jgi:parallel beta-helix repeat protein
MPHSRGGSRTAICSPTPCPQLCSVLPHEDNWYDNPSATNTPSVTQASEGQVQTPGSTHGPIHITSDAEFASQALAEGWAGNGTAVNPYLIQSLIIDVTNISTTCILISSTTVYFCIRGCFLRGPLWGWGTALIISNVTHGCVTNTTCTEATTGIIIESSTLITTANNHCINNRGWGIEVADSTSITIANNTCSDNYDFDIFIDYSRQNVIVNNTCSSLWGAIALAFSGDNTLINNSLIGSGLWLEAAGSFDGRQNLVSGNMVNGKPLLFWQDQVGGTVSAGFGQLILVNCTQATIQDATLIGTYAGIILCCCNETTVMNVECSYGRYGLASYNCYDCVVMGSTFSHNEWGIALTNSSSYNVIGNNTFTCNVYGIDLIGSENTLWNNTCIDGWCAVKVEAGSSNTIGGSWICNYSIGVLFWADSYANIVEANVFLGNLTEAFDDSNLGNVFDWNYWFSYHGRDWDGNGIGDTAFVVAGRALSRDYRPLMRPPGWALIWLELPGDQYLAYGSDLWYGLDVAAAPPGIASWWISDMTNFAIDAHGVITSRGVLPAGSYPVQVWVYDSIGNVINASFNIVVYGGTSIVQIPIIALVIAMVAVISTAGFVAIVGIAILRGRRVAGPPPVEPFTDTRPPVDTWNARCPVCGSRLFGDEGYCPGCGNRVTKPRDT